LPANHIPETDRIEQRLLILAGAFMGIYSLSLTLSNAARLRSWHVDYRWSHWLGFVIWVALAWLVHKQLSHRLTERDPFLFPVTALLTGWGILTIWRLSSGLGLRQTAWLLLIGVIFMLAVRFDATQPTGRILVYLRRYKYVWLTSGLVLTAATIFLGTNPMGAGPRLWLGCCGFYFQPSEPLKILLIVFLAAYLADRQAAAVPTTKLLPLLTPTLLMTGLALLLLVIQRDLGTAAIFIVLYAVIVFAGTGNKNVLIVSTLVLILAAVAGYLLFGVVSQRVDAWINPWIDPAGRSYQVVQSLLAVANGGLFGRGAGMGSPSLVPIAQSDFIFSAISEEAGLVGALGILVLLALLVNRGMRLGMKSADTFHRLLAIGLVVHLVGQSILIIAGNLRLLPLTGVTLPFVSYGGSSLLVSYFELLCLLLISARSEEIQGLQPEILKAQTKLNLIISGGLMLGLAGTAVIAGWWSLVRGPDLLTRTDNPRRSIADRYVKRGSILDRQDNPLAESSGNAGTIQRSYPYTPLGPLVGYTDPVYGQAGLEASLDPYLRGLKGYPALTSWWEHLIYGQPPPGLDVRLSLEQDLQTKADELMADHRGALVLLNAHTGEVLAMASSPNFDANQLNNTWASLVNDPNSPLLDRAAMGMYPAGNALGGFLMAASQGDPAAQYTGTDFSGCALVPTGISLGEVVAAGCTEPVKQMLSSMNSQELINLLDALGLFTSPNFPVETLSSSKPGEVSDLLTYLTGNQKDPASGALLRVSPLQMAMAAATLSNLGILPAPRLVMAVDTPQSGWVTLPETSQPNQALTGPAANKAAGALGSGDLPIWQVVSSNDESATTGAGTGSSYPGYSWYLGGTSPEWNGAPLALAVILEENDPQGVLEIGRSLFRSAINP
jgi:cell division protein FtsW (lipid II flippase)